MGREPTPCRSAGPQDSLLSPQSIESPEKAAYPRRFPRLGGQFQTKMPKSSGPLQRPQPQLMSRHFPYVKESDVSCASNCNNCPTESRPSSRDPVFGHGHEHETSRGGFLVHRPSEETDRFYRFVQPFFRSIILPVPPHETGSAWKQRLIQLHNNNEVPKKRSRAPRGGNKRKRDEGNEQGQIWNLEEIIQEQLSERKRMRSVILGEDDAFASHFLHLEYYGNARAAELGVLVGLSAGRASKMIRTKDRKNPDRSKQPHPSSSESWRGVYKGLHMTSILQQFQTRRCCGYGINGGPVISCRQDPENIHFDDADDLKGAWRSLLASGKALELQLQQEVPGTKKPLLSTIVSFVSNAYGLPIPETCFGTHHVIVEELSTCMLLLLKHVEKARTVQAKLRDMVSSEDGVGIDTGVLIKFLDTEGSSLQTTLDEAVQYRSFAETILKWENAAAALLDSISVDFEAAGGNDFLVVQQMVKEAKTHGFVSKVLVGLTLRMNKAYELRQRILVWKDSCHRGEKVSTKTVAGLVRDASRLNLMFPEVAALLKFNRDMDAWIERANIAIRSRISLVEIKILIQRGDDMPLELSEFLDKLWSRVHTAEEWLASLDDIVPFFVAKRSEKDLLSWIDAVRKALSAGKYNRVHDLTSDGSRIPVEVDEVKILQVELDAKNWTNKAKKWFPNNQYSKKGRLEDLREHLEKGQSLRERLVLSDDEKSAWTLEGESELTAIVRAADSWFDEYQPFIDGDNRRSQPRRCLSILKLRKIADEGISIYANLGSATNKITKILQQAELWYDQNESLLLRCNLQGNGVQSQSSQVASVSVEEMMKAVKTASADVPVDLEEAVGLKKLLAKTELWFDQVAVVAPKRGKRNGRTSRSKFFLKDLIRLIEETSSIPVNTREEVERLQIQLGLIKAWQISASSEILGIAAGFDLLREKINMAYGSPKEFTIEHVSKLEDLNGDDHRLQRIKTTQLEQRPESGPMMEEVDAEMIDTAPLTIEEQNSHLDTASLSGSDSAGTSSTLPESLTIVNGERNVYKMIRDLQKGTSENTVTTPEADLADLLEFVSRWCLRSLKYLGTPREIFDKRFHGAFDRFLSEGQDLHNKSLPSEERTDAVISSTRVSLHWGSLVSDQLERLKFLRREREKFSEWCEIANHAMSDEKRITFERLLELANQSKRFPTANDLLHKIRLLAARVNTWIGDVRKVLNRGQKLSMQEAKNLVEEGDKLKVNTTELKSLRASLRAARGWACRVKRCNLEQGSVLVSDVQDLVDEHDRLMIEMPEELSSLQQATQNYCICRRPYEGFMIGCDECEEWYHGPCIGVSESRADRVDKFVCIRCSLKNTFKHSANGAVSILRKWTHSRDLKKARQVQYQKHQRKVRKERKDIENFCKEIETLKSKLGTHIPETLLRAGEVKVQMPESLIMKVKPNPALPAITDAKNAIKMPPEESPLIKPPNLEQRNMTTEEPVAKIDEIEELIKEAEGRLASLVIQSDERKKLEERETGQSIALRRWCVRVRSLVLVPSRHDLAEEARPALKGKISLPMLSLLSDARKLGISQLPDVLDMENCFRCMSWGMYALSIFGRKPTISELESVMSLAADIKLPDEKAARTMRLILQKASQWQSKVKKIVAPKPGVTKPIVMDVLQDLVDGTRDFTVHLPETRVLKLIVKDKGTRHCLCGWPTDGDTMLFCDKCRTWFHRQCVGMSIEEANSLQRWLCKSCSDGTPATSPPLEMRVKSMHWEISSEEAADVRGEFSNHAPDLNALWPPFQLLGSAASIASLNDECIQIPDDTEPIGTAMGTAADTWMSQKIEASTDSTNYAAASSTTSVFVSEDAASTYYSNGIHAQRQEDGGSDCAVDHRVPMCSTQRFGPISGFGAAIEQTQALTLEVAPNLQSVSSNGGTVCSPKGDITLEYSESKLLMDENTHEVAECNVSAGKTIGETPIPGKKGRVISERRKIHEHVTTEPKSGTSGIDSSSAHSAPIAADLRDCKVSKGSFLETSPVRGDHVIALSSTGIDISGEKSEREAGTYRLPRISTRQTAQNQDMIFIPKSTRSTPATCDERSSESNDREGRDAHHVQDPSHSQVNPMTGVRKTSDQSSREN